MRPIDISLFILFQRLDAIAAVMIFGWPFSGSGGSPTDDTRSAQSPLWR
jgi:hypothetical protein